MQRIVVGVDGSENSRRALDWAVEEARLRAARLDVVYAWESPYIIEYERMAYDPTPYEEAARRVLDEMVSDRQFADLAALEKIPVNASAAWALLEVAKGADLLVVGSRGRGGFKGLLLGSVGQQVAYHAPCPVVVVPPKR